MNIPNPQRLMMALNVDNVETYKRLDCVHYGDCLSLVVRKPGPRWKQFHCNYCEAYEHCSIGELLVGFNRLQRAVVE